MSDIINLVHQELVAFVKAGAPTARLVQHQASKTSEESLRARRAASGEPDIGAKALLIKIGVRDKPDAFAVIVLPSSDKLDSKALKRELKARVPGMRSFRFATPEEMHTHARGMEPGRMPPFGRPLFPGVDFTFIDAALADHPRIGFNAADFKSSIIMDCDDYLTMVTHDGIFVCSSSS